MKFYNSMNSRAVVMAISFFKKDSYAAKAVWRGKFIVIYANVKKQDRSQIKNLTLHHKELRGKIEPRVSRTKEVIKIKADIKKMETKGTVGKKNNQ